MPAANQSDFFGEGLAVTDYSKPYDPNDEPNPNNPGGVSNNALKAQQASRPAAQYGGYRQPNPAARAAPVDTRTAEQKAVAAYQHGNTGGAAGAYNATTDAGRAAFDATHKVNQGTKSPFTTANVLKAGRFAVDPIGGTAALFGGPVAQIASGPAGAALVGSEVAAGAVNQPGGAPPRAPTAPAAAVPGAAGHGVAPPTPIQGDPGAAGGAPATPTAPGGFTPQASDYSRYDAAAEELRASRDVFASELARLSGVDPFGNQAFLQKATDRGVAQAAGTAAGARGGAAAQAGAQRAQQGIQSQLAARGGQEMEQVVQRDANAAAGLRLNAASGMAGVSSQLAENEVAFANKAADVGVANLQAATEKYGVDAQIGQRERESLRSLATEMKKVDMERYKTDVQYRANVDDNIIAKYVSDNALSGVMAQIEAQENLSKGEILMGLLGAGSGIAQGVVMKSDRRSKYAIRGAKASELKEYLTKTGGSHYRYRQPDAPGQRQGENFGPMAQDLRSTKIGRTVVVEKADGLYVDTGRLALADHGALVALAQRVERLARKVSPKK